MRKGELATWQMPFMRISMANLSLALQGGVALGTEQTFDGQPMQAGTHLRWSFVSAMGFPPGGFQLWRRTDDGPSG